MGPLRWRCQRVIEPRTAAPFDSQIPKEHPHRCQNHSDGIAPVVSIPLCYEVPQARSRIRLWIVSKKFDQVGYVKSIGDPGRFDGSTMSCQPLKKLMISCHGISGCAALMRSDTRVAASPTISTNFRIARKNIRSDSSSARLRCLVRATASSM